MTARASYAADLETTLTYSPLRSDEAYLEKRHRLSLVLLVGMHGGGASGVPA
jgi:hypothetical protein